MAGLQAENLLNFDDAPAQEECSGLMATQHILPQTPAATSFLSGVSTNPLDDLLSIFGGMSTVGVGAGTGSGNGGVGTIGGLGLGEFGRMGSTASPPPAGASPLEVLLTYNPDQGSLCFWLVKFFQIGTQCGYHLRQLFSGSIEVSDLFLL